MEHLDIIPATLHHCTVDDGFTFASVGDLIGPSRPETPRQSAGFSAVTALLQQSDISFANQEGSIFNIDTFKGYRAAENGGGYPLSDAVVADDLRAMGFNVVSKANNHATDWGVEGLLATGESLSRAGVAFAGAGSNLNAARAPAFLETAKGRVAVISAASTYTPMSPAGHADGEIGPRPGINALATTAVTLLEPQDMLTLARAAQRQGMGTSLDSRAHGTPESLQLGEAFFASADQAGLSYRMNPGDRKAITRAIRGAKQVSDFVAFSLHGHESLSGDGNDCRPADFMPILFREAIDCGADMVINTGPHLLRGIEIYRGKPILYGLGSFFLQLEGGRGPTFDVARKMQIDPDELTKPEYIRKIFTFPDSWYDSMLPVCEFRAGRLATMRIYPLRLTQTPHPSLQGAPRLATGSDAERILKKLQQNSAPFGTEILIEGDTGVITL